MWCAVRRNADRTNGQDMSDSDSFIEEVSEEVRRDRLFHLMRRWGWIPVVLVVVLVGGAAVNEYRKATSQGAAERLGDGITAALEGGADDRADALAGLEADGGGRALVAFLESDAALERDDPAAAVSALQAIESDATLPDRYRHLATLKRVMAADPAMPPDERIAALSALTTPGAPYRLLALEMTAVAQAEAGDSAAAISGLQAILNDSEASEGLRRRASQLIVALGGDPADLIASDA